LKLLDDVKVVGGLSQNKLISFLKIQNMLVLPSVEEGIANVVLEAMAIGLTVISTGCGGMAEVVIPKKTGWLIPMRNGKAIAEAVIDVYDTDASKRSEILLNAHNLIKKEFNYDKSIAAFIKLYDELN
jgi:colanic acid/amylovoran biosynthesis glycosyltransferase